MRRNAKTQKRKISSKNAASSRGGTYTILVFSLYSRASTPAPKWHKDLHAPASSSTMYTVDSAIHTALIGTCFSGQGKIFYSSRAWDATTPQPRGHEHDSKMRGKSGNEMDEKLLPALSRPGGTSRSALPSPVLLSCAASSAASATFARL